MSAALYIHFNGFWSGFFERTNPTHVGFFLQLLEKVYDKPVQVGTVENSDILVENTQVTQSVRQSKTWMHTYMVSGESYLHADHSKYTCVLFGNRNHGNVVNMPQYVPYLISSFDESVILENKPLSVTRVPNRDVLVVVSNPNGALRNRFCSELEKRMNVTYGGHYKNNTGRPIEHLYNSKAFLEYVGSFKFIVTMENSEEETYITEKITHGLLGGSIPVYWGSKRVTEYFNAERILNLESEASIGSMIQTMKDMSDETWLRKVNSKPFTLNGSRYGLDQMSKYIKNVVFPRPFPLLNQVYFLCNKEFEPKRYDRIQKMCVDIGLNDYNYTCISPTYKHTITDADYNRCVKNDLVARVRRSPMKRSEVSLFMNFKAAFEHATMYFRDSMILTLESDVFVKPNYMGLNVCLEKLQNKPWDCIHLGGAGDVHQQPVPFIEGKTMYRDIPDRTRLYANAIEDLSSSSDELRFSRRFHTRCCDSLLWRSSGCESFLRHMRNDTNYGAPFDYYFTNKLETDMAFKHYWSYVYYFEQGSNTTPPMEESTIQND